MARTVPVIASEVPGNFQTAALWTAQVSSIMQWLIGSGGNGLPLFFGYQLTAQSVPTGFVTGTPITLDTEVIDTDGGHSTVTNTSRYTCQVAGYYLIWGNVAWVTNATEQRITSYSKNGVPIVGGSAVQANPVTSGHVSVIPGNMIITPLAVGDYIEMLGAQAGASPLATQADGSAGKNSSLLCMWIHA